MSTQNLSRRAVLRTLMVGAAGAAVGACGGGKPPPPAAAPEPAPAPAAAPAADPTPTVAADPVAAPAGPLPLLSPTDPTAVALKYTDDASKVDAAAFPTYAKGQACANCLQFQGAAGDTHGPCSIFPGKAVAATGWCMVYAKKA